MDADKVYHPRGSPEAALLKKFYGTVALMSLIQPNLNTTKYETLDTDAVNSTKLWQRYLDSLATLCDREKGGKTVTAIAVQQTEIGPVYHIASNARVKEAAIFLDVVLKKLGSICTNPSTISTQMSSLLSLCIDHCAPRIRDQARYLRLDLLAARRSAHELGNTEVLAVLSSLEDFQDQTLDHAKLCQAAYDFRTSKNMQFLTEKRDEDAACVWGRIRHHIGRLGVFHKAVSLLVRCTIRCPKLIENAKVLKVKQPKKVDALNSGDAPTMNEIIDEVVGGDIMMKGDLLTALNDSARLNELEQDFLVKYKSLEPRHHAELVVAEKFWAQRFRFVDENNYIGCSKPPCYLCALYRERHRQTFSLRSTHGNLWSNWAPPTLLNPTKQKSDDSKEQPPSSTFEILQDMLTTLREDLKEHIVSSAESRPRAYDSTTGMLSSVVEEGAWVYLEHLSTWMKTLPEGTAGGMEQKEV